MLSELVKTELNSQGNRKVDDQKYECSWLKYKTK